MTDYICEKFQEVIDLLNETFKVCDETEIAELLQQAIKILQDLYSPLKDLYYAHLICKELYCEVRTCRERAIELLGGKCESFEQGICVRFYTGALQVLNDTGGDNCGEADVLIKEAIEIVCECKNALCKCCQYDSCNSSCSKASDSCDTSCSNSCSNSCDTSSSSCSSSSSSCGSSSSSCGSSSSCDTSSSCSRC